MGTLGLLFILIPRSLVALVTHDAALIDASAPLLFVVGFAQIGFGVAMVLGGALRGAGDTRSAMALTFTSTYLVRLPLVWWVGLHMGWDLKMVWVVMSAELTLRGVLFLARFLHGGWMRVEV